MHVYGKPHAIAQPYHNPLMQMAKLRIRDNYAG